MACREALALLVLAGLVYAQGSFYADVVFDVSGSGSVAVSGRANHPLLSGGSVDSFTSKRGSFWLLNITLPVGDVFSDYVYVVRLPEGASVNYVKSAGSWRISTDGGRIAVHGVGRNETFNVVVQYQIGTDEPKVEETAADSSIYYYLAAGVAVIIVAAALLSRKNKEPAEELSYDPNMLTRRQKQIMELVKQEGKPMNQAAVCERLNLPKSSVSRNVESLVKMGLLKKTRTGMSTMIYLSSERRV